MLAIGRLILQHINATGEGKADFAKRAGIAPQQLSTWINPDTKLHEYPKPATLRGLAAALGLSHREVLDIISTDVGMHLDDVDLDPGTTLLIASARPLSDKRKARLIQIARDLADD